MVDTVRARSDLLALLADNTAGDISAQDMRDVLVSVHGVYGAIYTTNASAAQTGVDTTPEKLVAFDTDGISAGTTPDHTNDQITIGTAGVVLVLSSVNATGDANTIWEFSIHKNGSDTNYHFDIEFDANGDESNAAGFALLSVAANDIITLYVASDQAGGASITVDDAQLIVIRIA